MSEVMMFAQMKDVKCMSSKRSLAIIATPGGNVAELKTYSNCQQTISNISIDKACVSPDALHSDDKKEYTDPPSADSKRSQKMTKGKRRNASKLSASSSKSQHHFKKQLDSASSMEKPRRNPTLAKPLAESKNEVSESSPTLSWSNKEPGHYDADVAQLKYKDLERNDADIAQLKDKDLESNDADITQLKDKELESNDADIAQLKDKELESNDAYIAQLKDGMTFSNTSNSDSKHLHEHLGLEIDSSCTKLISNEELVSCVDSQTTSPVVYNDCQNNAQEVHGVLQLASLSISLPASQSVAPGSPDRGCPFWNQTADLKHVHGRSNSTEQNVPQITITSVEGLHCRNPMTITPSPDTDDDTMCKFASLISNSSSMFGQTSTNRTCGHVSGKRPKLVAHLSKIMNAESTGSLFDRERSSGSRCDLPTSENPASMQLSDFWRLKETTEKLHLSTRRPSTMLWRQQYIESQGLPTVKCNQNRDVTGEDLTDDKMQWIDDALQWLRNELQEMRSQDQNLARQLLAIRQDIHQLKLQRSTEEHQELIEDFQSELDDLQECSDVLDLPQPMYGNNPLKHVGVTRLNISARRFSAC